MIIEVKTKLKEILSARPFNRLGNNVKKSLTLILPLLMLLSGSGEAELFSGNIATSNQYAASNEAYIIKAHSMMQSDPKYLLRLTRKEIGYLFGLPTFSRKDADARVWQYKTKGCVVDFYFYDNKALSDESSVSYVDMRFKEELYPGSRVKTSISSQEKSQCLDDAVSTGKTRRNNSKI